MSFNQWIKKNRPYQSKRDPCIVNWEYIEQCMEKAYYAGVVQANVDALKLMDSLEQQYAIRGD